MKRESEQGETALDGLAAKQMWMREGEVYRGRENGKDGDREEREESIFIDRLVT